MRTIIQHIKNNLRNKRFLIFTLLFPSAWYLFFIYFLSDQVNINATNLAIFSSMFGIGGSGLNTFSTKVSNEINYYGKIRYYSPYTYLKYISDSIVAQTLLNLLIIVVVTIIGIVINKLEFSQSYMVISILLILYGVYYISIGFVLGISLKSETLNSLSLPIYMIFMAMNITPNAVNFGNFKFLEVVQKIFPGYYFNALLQDLNANNILKFIAVITIHIIIILIIIFIKESTKFKKGTSNV